MPFVLDGPDRVEPRWVEYRHGSVSARFLVLPKDQEFVDGLNRKYAPEQRLDRAGRIKLDPKAPEKERSWLRDYLVHHVKDWDVTLAAGGTAPIDGETVLRLTDGMQAYILEASGADDLRDYQADPLAG